MGSPTWGGCTPPTAIASLTAHWSPVTGHQSLVTSHRSPLIAHRTLRTGTVHRTLRTMHCTSHNAHLDPGEPNATRARPRQDRMGAQQACHSCIGLRAAPEASALRLPPPRDTVRPPIRGASDWKKAYSPSLSQAFQAFRRQGFRAAIVRESIHGQTLRRMLRAVRAARRK